MLLALKLVRNAFNFLFEEIYFLNRIYLLLASNDNPPSIPQASEDIIEMESKFSKTSQDKIINEQEEILKKIKAQKLAEKNILEDWPWVSGDRGRVTTLGNFSKFNHVSHATTEVNKHTQGIIHPYEHSSI